MEAQLKILEFRDALLIRATERPTQTAAIVSALVASGFAAIILKVVSGLWSSLLAPDFLTVIAVTASLGFLVGRFPRSAELRVTNLEYAARRIGFWGAREKPSLCSADIRWLEYQEDESGPEYDHPGGLYAILKHTSVSLLPYLNAEQTISVIEQIERRFPAHKDQWLRSSEHTENRFGGSVISLDLNSREPGRGKS